MPVSVEGTDPDSVRRWRVYSGWNFERDRFGVCSGPNARPTDFSGDHYDVCDWRVCVSGRRLLLEKNYEAVRRICLSKTAETMGGY